jgi:small conductance mechanosensitive channel
MRTILERLGQLLDPDRIAEWAVRVVPDAILGLIVFAIFYLFYRSVAWLVARITRRVGLDRTAASFISLGLKYVILAIGAMASLQQIGVDVTSLIAGVGIFGIALAFAAKETMANLAAGLTILWDKPFVVGDLIEASGEYGEVRRITLRATRVVTVDGKLLSIPNSILVNSVTKSYTMEPHLRLDIDVSVGVNEDIGKARRVILGIIAGDERFLSVPPPEVLVTTLGDYFVGLQLRVWLDDARVHIRVAAELRERVKNALDVAGIVMPYETLNIIRRRMNPEPASGRGLDADNRRS